MNPRPYPRLGAVAIATALSGVASASPLLVVPKASRATTEAPAVVADRALRSVAGIDRTHLAAARIESYGHGTLVVYEQEVRGVPVDGGRVIVRLDDQRRVRYVRSTALPIPADLSVAPSLAVDRARAIAALAIGGAAPIASRLVIRAFGQPKLVWEIGFAYDDGHLWRVIVDANGGAVLAREDLARNDSSGFPGANAYEPSSAVSPLKHVELTTLPANATSLADDHFTVASCVDPGTCTALPDGMGGTRHVHQCTFSPLAHPDANGDFAYDPPADPQDGTDPFAEAHAYYHLNKIYPWFEQLSLGELALHPIRVHTNVKGSGTCNGTLPSGPLPFFENSQFIPGSQFGGVDQLVFGQGAKFDYAIDGDVVYHELGHAAILSKSQISPSLLFNAHALAIPGPTINEALADYFAAAFTGDSLVGNYVGQLIDGDGRDVDNTLTCSHDLTGEPHLDGRFFSGALWAVRKLVPNPEMFDGAVLRASWQIGPNDDFKDVADLVAQELESEQVPGNPQKGSPFFLLLEELSRRGVYGMQSCEDRILDVALATPSHAVYLKGVPGFTIPGPLQYKMTLFAPLPDGLVATGTATTSQTTPITLELRLQKATPITLDPQVFNMTGDLQPQTPVTAQFTYDPTSHELRAVASQPLDAGDYYVMLTNSSGVTFKLDDFTLASPGDKADDPGHADMNAGGCAAGGGSSPFALLGVAAMLVMRRSKQRRTGR